MNPFRSAVVAMPMVLMILFGLPPIATTGFFIPVILI